MSEPKLTDRQLLLLADLYELEKAGMIQNRETLYVHDGYETETQEVELSGTVTHKGVLEVEHFYRAHRTILV